MLATFGLSILPPVGSALAADPPQNAQRKGTGLPLPRFASLRSDEANVRSGPGTRYPIEWVFRRKGMPVEIGATISGRFSWNSLQARSSDWRVVKACRVFTGSGSPTAS